MLRVTLKGTLYVRVPDVLGSGKVSLYKLYNCIVHIVSIYIVVHLYLPIIKLFLISFELHATKFLKV